VASIRRARPEDLGEIVGMRIEFERITRDSDAMDEAARRAELAGLLGPDLASGALIAWIAEAEGRAAGQAALRLARGTGELMNVYVRPGFRRRGVGAALVRAALDEARALGLGRITLQPTEDSRRIYEREGFAAEGRRMVLLLPSAAGR
jgi:GNAT superfamily N-acetyltransferase